MKERKSITEEREREREKVGERQREKKAGAAETCARGESRHDQNQAACFPKRQFAATSFHDFDFADLCVIRA